MRRDGTVVRYDEASAGLTHRQAVGLFVIVILAWGLSWPMTKIIVREIPPLWTNTLRLWIAFGVVTVLQTIGGHVIIPKRGDVPVVLCIGLLHMVVFSTLVAAGLRFIPASKGIVLGYTTPLWVAALAPALLGERLTRRHATGIACGLAGLAVIFNPRSFDWSDGHALLGCGLIVLAALFWAINIVYVRTHRWIATPFQLLLWQTLLAAIVLTALALTLEGEPHFRITGELSLLVLYGGAIGTALAYWAMSLVSRSLTAMTTSLGLLATPVVGIASASAALHETVTPSLITSAVLIVGGIAIGTISDTVR